MHYVNPFSNIEVEYIRDISTDDKDRVLGIFDFQANSFQELVDSGEAKLRGQRNAIIKLIQPQTFNNIPYKFVKVKGHHYMTADGSSITSPSPQVYPDKAGMPINIKRINCYHSPNKLKLLKLNLKKHFDRNFLGYCPLEQTKDLMTCIYYTKPPSRPKGAMVKREIDTEIALEERCLKKGILAPVPVAKIKYPFKFKGQETYAYLCAVPDDAEDIGLMMGDHAEDRDVEKFNELIKMQHKALRKLNEADIIHLFFHYGNSYFLGDTEQIVYHDFEDGLDISELDSHHKAQYKILDLTEVMARSAHFTYFFRKNEVKEFLGMNFFETGLVAYLGCDPNEVKEISEDFFNTNDMYENSASIDRRFNELVEIIEKQAIFKEK